jgi:hypothetical protein
MVSFAGIADVIGPALGEMGRAYSDAVLNLPKVRAQQELIPLEVEKAQLGVEKLRRDVEQPYKPIISPWGAWFYNPQTRRYEFDARPEHAKQVAAVEKMNHLVTMLKNPDPQVQEVARSELSRMQAPMFSATSQDEFRKATIAERKRAADVREPYVKAQIDQIQANIARMKAITDIDQQNTTIRAVHEMNMAYYQQQLVSLQGEYQQILRDKGVTVEGVQAPLPGGVGLSGQPGATRPEGYPVPPSPPAPAAPPSGMKAPPRVTGQPPIDEFTRQYML